MLAVPRCRALAARLLSLRHLAPLPSSTRWERQFTAVSGQAGERATASAAAAAAAAAAATSQQASPLGWQEQQQQQLPPQHRHLQGLSEEQLAAVTAPLGTVRVVAGPGSGKVRRSPPTLPPI